MFVLVSAVGAPSCTVRGIAVVLSDRCAVVLVLARYVRVVAEMAAFRYAPATSLVAPMVYLAAERWLGRVDVADALEQRARTAWARADTELPSPADAPAQRKR